MAIDSIDRQNLAVPSKIRWPLDQMIGRFCQYSAQKQAEPLPIENAHTLCVENLALFIVKVCNINILARFLALIFTRFVPGIYVLLKFTF